MPIQLRHERANSSELQMRWFQVRCVEVLSSEVEKLRDVALVGSGCVRRRVAIQPEMLEERRELGSHAADAGAEAPALRLNMESAGFSPRGGCIANPFIKGGQSPHRRRRLSFFFFQTPPTRTC